MSRAQSRKEELANVLTHAPGVILGLLGLLYLCAQAGQNLDLPRLISFSLFCLALAAQCLVSSLYHGAPASRRKERLHIWDHALIYVLIAGTYSPFALLALRGALGWKVLAFVWTAALIGILFKLRFTDRFRFLSTFLYLAMGWSVVFVFQPVASALPFHALGWLVAGGIAYSLGVIFFLCERLPYHHAIWHLFVLLGAISHLLAVSSLA